jgi:hypothetical protein
MSDGEPAAKGGSTAVLFDAHDGLAFDFAYGSTFGESTRLLSYRYLLTQREDQDRAGRLPAVVEDEQAHVGYFRPSRVSERLSAPEIFHVRTQGWRPAAAFSSISPRPRAPAAPSPSLAMGQIATFASP